MGDGWFVIGGGWCWVVVVGFWAVVGGVWVVRWLVVLLVGGGGFGRCWWGMLGGVGLVVGG